MEATADSVQREMLAPGACDSPDSRCDHSDGRTCIAPSTLREVCSFPIAVLLVSASLLLVRMFHLAHHSFEPMEAIQVAYGRTEAPFHLRLLAPMLARLGLESSGAGSFLHWHFVVQFVFVLASLATMHVWLRSFFSRTETLIGILVAPIVLLWSVDMPAADAFPQVFFFAAAFLTLYERRAPMFLLIFAVAVMNRETIAALLLPFFIVFRRTLKPATLGLYLVVMLGWVIAWKLYVGPLLSPARVPNKLALFQWTTNLEMWSEWRHTLNPFAKNPFTILAYTWILVPYAWRELPPFCRMLCLCWIPYFVLMLFVARATETRVYMEWTPLALVVCAAAIRRAGNRNHLACEASNR